MTDAERIVLLPRAQRRPATDLLSLRDLRAARALILECWRRRVPAELIAFAAARPLADVQLAVRCADALEAQLDRDILASTSD